MDEITIRDSQIECPNCGTWGSPRLTDRQAVVLAVQLLVAATNLPLELLWPTTTAGNHDG